MPTIYISNSGSPETTQNEYEAVDWCDPAANRDNFLFLVLDVSSNAVMGFSQEEVRKIAQEKPGWIDEKFRNNLEHFFKKLNNKIVIIDPMGQEVWLQGVSKIGAMAKTKLGSVDFGEFAAEIDKIFPQRQDEV